VGASSARRAPQALFAAYAQRAGRPARRPSADAQLVQFVETQLAGAIGSASARVMVATRWWRRSRWASAT
jgi:hypothetical protein